MRFPLLLRNGLFAGIAAGLVAALLQWLITEPVIRRALEIEDRAAAAEGGAGHSHDELVSRGEQVGYGMLTAFVIAVVFGVILSVVYARVRPRLPGQADFGRGVWLAAFGFFAFALMPMLAIPANPPGFGDPSTVDRRTLIYFAAILCGLLVVGAAGAVDRLLAARDRSLRITVNTLAFAGITTLALVIVPNTPDKIPTTGDASLIAGADLIWDFRLASLLQLGAMWLVLGLVFGMLMSRVAQPAEYREPALSS